MVVGNVWGESAYFQCISMYVKYNFELLNLIFILDRTVIIQKSKCKKKKKTKSFFTRFKCSYPTMAAQLHLEVTHESRRFKCFSFISQPFLAHLLVIKWTSATD